MKVVGKHMVEKRERDAIPQHFQDVAEAAQFWDTHDLGDYWDQTREASFDVDIQRRVFLTPLEPELAKSLGAFARSQGVSTETLINLWLVQKLAEVSQGH